MSQFRSAGPFSFCSKCTHTQAVHNAKGECAYCGDYCLENPRKRCTLPIGTLVCGSPLPCFWHPPMGER
jgi:hypothetical protein